VAKFTIVISMLLGTSYVLAWSVGLSLEKFPSFRTGKTLKRTLRTMFSIAVAFVE
jgi:hypothetical protein